MPLGTLGPPEAPTARTHTAWAARARSEIALAPRAPRAAMRAAWSTVIANAPTRSSPPAAHTLPNRTPASASAPASAAWTTAST